MKREGALSGRVFPRRLSRGDRVSLVAPSGSAADADRVRASIGALEALGFEVAASSHCADRKGYLAGEDGVRAGELMRAFLDPETAAVICLKGGYGTPRILDRLDYGAIRAHPKVFLGYSDITALHVAFRRLSGLVTFHGPMPSSDMVPVFHPDSRASLERALFPDPARRYPWRIENISGTTLRTLARGKKAGGVSGELAGGNLSLICATLGTPWGLDPEGKILFIEDIDEAPYRIDRMLNQLRLAGVFDACAGLIIGSWTRCESAPGKPTLPIENIILELAGPSGIPIVAGLEAGHGEPSLTLPLGLRYTLNPENATLELLESPFEPTSL